MPPKASSTSAPRVAVAQAVMKQHPEVNATIEHATADGSRRADVMPTWPDGGQVAVEIQYSNLPVLEWEERHTSYRRQGIHDVSLMGRHRIRGHCNSFEALEPEETMFTARRQVAWIDVDEERLFITYKDGRLPRPEERFSLWQPLLKAVDWSPDGMLPAG